MIDVAAILAKARERSSSKRFAYWFSNLNDPCLRALVYDAQDTDDGKTGKTEVKPLSWLLSGACGTAVGDHLEQAAKALGYETQKPHAFEVGSIRISGRSDIASPSEVLDIKLVSEKKWAKIQTKPDPGHLSQVNGYAVQNDSSSWAILYVRGLSIFDGSEEPETKIYRGETSIDLAQELCGIAESVEHHRRFRTLPERVWGASPRRWPCGWCRHLDRCGPVEQEQDNA